MEWLNNITQVSRNKGKESRQGQEVEGIFQTKNHDNNPTTQQNNVG